MKRPRSSTLMVGLSVSMAAGCVAEVEPEVEPVSRAPAVAGAGAMEPNRPPGNVSIADAGARGESVAKPDAGGASERAPARRCAPPRDVSGSPRDIGEAVALMNALPRPTSLACFVESLSRPLQVYFTSSQFSAQPAAGEDSPRTFIVNDRLFLAFVPEGPAKDLLELGHRTSADRAIRAEIVFPLTRAVRAADIAEHIALTDRNTFCGNCHGQETQTEDAFLRDQAFESGVIPPNPADEIELTWLRDRAARCDASAAPERCELLSALFDQGELTPSRAFELPAR